MKSIPLAEADSLLPLVAYLEARNAPVDRYLEKHRIAREWVEERSRKITKLQVFSFLEDSAAGEGMPDLGYRMGEQFGPLDMGRLGCAIMSARTLGDALATFGELIPCWFGDSRVWLTVEGEQVWLNNEGLDGIHSTRDIANQNASLMLANIVKLVADEGWQPEALKVGANARIDWRINESLANTEVAYTSGITSVRFPKLWLQRELPLPVVRSSFCEGFDESPESLVDQVRLILEQQIADVSVPSFHDVALLTGISERSLSRYFKQAGVSFQLLLDRARFPIARKILREHPDMPVSEVAKRMGYSGSNNFDIAFKRFTGMTPSNYRIQEMSE